MGELENTLVLVSEEVVPRCKMNMTGFRWNVLSGELCESPGRFVEVSRILLVYKKQPGLNAWQKYRSDWNTFCQLKIYSANLSREMSSLQTVILVAMFDCFWSITNSCLYEEQTLNIFSWVVLVKVTVTVLQASFRFVLSWKFWTWVYFYFSNLWKHQDI